jgi:hypothetical protein
MVLPLTARAPGERWTACDGVHIELRGLAAPAPLVQTLQLIESLTDATPVILHHDRDPALLYAELAQRGWSIRRIPGDPNEFRFLLSTDA